METSQKKSMTYGIRSVRQIKQCNRPSDRRTKKVIDAQNYFVRKVDPIISKCITYLLCLQQDDAPVAMLDFLTKWRDGTELDPLPLMTFTKPRKDQKIFLATTIGPIISKLVNRVALARPENVLDYFCNELTQMIQVEKIFLEDKKPTSSQPHASAPLEAIKPIVARPAAQFISPRNKSMSAAESAVTNIMTSAFEQFSEPKTIQILLVGLGTSGKTSFVSAIQGQSNPNVRPTMGFRQANLALSSTVKVSLYDVGGGKKVRELWSQYYGDAHAIIFVHDATIDPKSEEFLESKGEFHKVLREEQVTGKPILIIANKQDTTNAVSPENLRQLLEVPADNSLEINILGCSSIPLPPNDASPEEDHSFDPNIETSIDWLLKRTQVHYRTLNDRVLRDIRLRTEEEARKRTEKERRVLRNKIACAFPSQVHPSKLPEGASTTVPEDVFSEEDGLAFIAGEIGEEVNRLEPIAKEVAILVGYQKLALQIIGTLKAPVSKKKTPMSWEDIKALVLVLRKELELQ